MEELSFLEYIKEKTQIPLINNSNTINNLFDLEKHNKEFLEILLSLPVITETQLLDQAEMAEIIKILQDKLPFSPITCYEVQLIEDPERHWWLPNINVTSHERSSLDHSRFSGGPREPTSFHQRCGCDRAFLQVWHSAVCFL